MAESESVQVIWDHEQSSLRRDHRLRSLLSSRLFVPQALCFIGTLPTLYLYTTTTGSIIRDAILACCILCCILAASDLLLLVEPEHEARQPEAPNEIVPIGATRAKWPIRLISSFCRAGWDHEPSVLRQRPAVGTSRTYFLVEQMFRVFVWVLVLDMSALYIRQSPAYKTNGIPFTDRPWYWGVTDIVFGIVTIESSMKVVQGIIRFASVALHLLRPEDWAPAFGFWSDPYTLRHFWGQPEPQFLRRILTTPGRFVTRKVLHLRPGTNGSSYVQLYIAFLLSGLGHCVDEPMVGTKWWSLPFFILQATSILLENEVIAGAQGLEIRKRRIVNYFLGYVWVGAWFYMAQPIWWDPMRRAGIWDMYNNGAFLPIRVIRMAR